jgi:DNA-binding NtrC family response regulator
MNTSELQIIKQRYNIVGNSPGLNRALTRALQVAPTDLSVLIMGESGVGKEIIPRVIHDNSPRKREKYFAINCGSIPEGTIDSELFGHEKGSFTGAIGESEGYFGAANKGTIFLDELGEMPVATQARLLRVLENGEYIRVGGTQVRKTDVRVVAATNVNLTKAISEGRFREDLYYRLLEVPIQMPPLRDRGEDIILLFRLFAMQTAEQYRLPKITLTEEARKLMLQYKWPGNIRQLKNVTRQMSVMSEQREITPELLRQFIPQDTESTMLATIPSNNSRHSYENEREALYQVLSKLGNELSDLRHDMNNLRKQLDDVRNTNFIPSAAAVQKMPTIIGSQSSISAYEEAPKTEDAVAEEIKAEPETLNLENIGRQMVEKALERNKGNRKKAAAELGISDRTLYRRIKQYGLDTLCALLFMILCVPMLSACSVSYSFTGASINYDVTKTITIADFPIRSNYVWGPMAGIFNNRLKDEFASHTKLRQVKRNGDLVIEGEISKYEQRNKSVTAEGHSAMTELTMTVNVRFTNNTNHSQDFEQQFTSSKSYETTQNLNAVQEELVTQMSKDIVDQIFNATVANW